MCFTNGSMFSRFPTSALGQFGLCRSMVISVIDTSARVPVEEPAVEPAPAEAPDDNLSLGEKLRQAVMSGSQDDLKRLFEQCSRAPPKKAVDADHLAAFAAFDDLLKPPEEVEPAVRPPEGAQGHSWLPPGGSGGFAGDLLGDGPSTSVARIPAEAQSETAEAAAQSNGQLGSGPAMFFIGDDPQEETPDFAALAAGGGGGAEPRLTPRRVEQLMSNGTGSNLTPQQLERLSPQELLQLQAMISSALQARAPPPQPVSSMRSPAPAPWQATAYRPADRIASFDLAQKDPEQQAPFGELLDMFQKKNTLGSS
ncbi:hypothetical protein AK812_SmicGene39082 [Symbiodinium microadriaticum]|uniref:Uncharacterized protein n=1 Tax=Symbiodinium microadriaticum TaxID=2951 RepID=A0A1Q9CC49_SYMMI|nr:hypothetical protein AK812_SmicGene39082 [Symbiodinium microadriaticum]CAE7322430.1 unnamed protein product [Symbiodinium sp. KB8]